MRLCDCAAYALFTVSGRATPVAMPTKHPEGGRSPDFVAPPKVGFGTTVVVAADSDDGCSSSSWEIWSLSAKIKVEELLPNVAKI